MKPLPDHLRKGLDILFVGFNPSIRSGETGHHFASPSNRFWTILYQAGLTPRKFRPEEDADLLDLGYGLTNIVSRPTRAAAEITEAEYAEGRLLLQEKIYRFRPKIVCFVGKGVYQKYCGLRDVAWGVQEEPMVQGVTHFVAPSSSGLVRIKLAEIVEIFSQLGAIVP